MTERTYRSLFLGKYNLHQCYFGWNLEKESPGLRVLRKCYGPFFRILMLLEATGRDALTDSVLKVANCPLCIEVVIHDFDDILAQPVVLKSLRFQRSSAAERLLNIATFAIDLTHDHSSLRAAMSADYRRKLRKAEAAGFEVEVHEQPSPNLIDKFLSVYSTFAATRGLAVVSRDLLCRMYEDGQALLLLGRCRGEVRNFLHLYMTDETGFFMYGVSPVRENDGGGQFMHWRAMQELKRRGRVWYDLGGVPFVNETNGIYQFKEKFGGQFVPLGSEWRHCGRMIKPVVATLQLVRRTLHATGRQ